MANRSLLYAFDVQGGAATRVHGLAEYNWNIAELFKLMLVNSPRIVASVIWKDSYAIVAKREGASQSLADYVAAASGLAKSLGRKHYQAELQRAMAVLTATPETEYLLLEFQEIASLSGESSLAYAKELLAQLPRVAQHSLLAFNNVGDWLIEQLSKSEDGDSHLAGFWSEHLSFELKPGFLIDIAEPSAPLPRAPTKRAKVAPEHPSNKPVKLSGRAARDWLRELLAQHPALMKWYGEVHDPEGGSLSDNYPSNTTILIENARTPGWSLQPSRSKVTFRVIEGDVVADNLLLSGEWTTLLFTGNVTARNVFSEAASVVVLGEIHVNELGMFALADTSLAVFGHAHVGILCAGNGVFDHNPMGWAGAFSAYGSLSADALMGNVKGTRLTPKTPDRVVDLVQPSLLSKADPTLLDVNQVDKAFRAGVPLLRNASMVDEGAKPAKHTKATKPAKSAKSAKSAQSAKAVKAAHGAG